MAGGAWACRMPPTRTGTRLRRTVPEAHDERAGEPPAVSERVRLEVEGVAADGRAPGDAAGAQAHVGDAVHRETVDRGTCPGALSLDGVDGGSRERERVLAEAAAAPLDEHEAEAPGRRRIAGHAVSCHEPRHLARPVARSRAGGVLDRPGGLRASPRACSSRKRRQVPVDGRRRIPSPPPIRPPASISGAATARRTMARRRRRRRSCAWRSAAPIERALDDRQAQLLVGVHSTAPWNRSLSLRIPRDACWRAAAGGAAQPLAISS